MAPAPAGVPAYACFIAGSSFAHGFQASHLWKSFTWAKTTGAGAAIVAVRATRYSEGRVAMMATNAMTITASTARIFVIMLGHHAAGPREGSPPPRTPGESRSPRRPGRGRAWPI